MVTRKIKISLDQMRRMDIYQPIDQPQIVYHMTPRKNLEKILQDGFIDTMTDYVCFFFPELKYIPFYIELSGADKGRQYYDFDGKIHTAPPLIHEETVVLKLIPRYIEPMHWYQEIVKATNEKILARACLKNVKTPNQRIFFRCAALKILEIRQDSCEFLPCPAKKSLAVGHSAIYQTSPNDKKAARAKIQQFNDCRVCHYGNLKFKRDVDVIELVDIDKMTFDDMD